MSFTLLLDLDDTLLINPVGRFLPAYMQALSRHLSGFATPEEILSALQAGTRQMMINDQPDCSLEEVFSSVFYQQIGHTPQGLQEAIRDFYDQVYPAIQEITSPAPGAIRLVEEAFLRGYRVVVATAPLFPATATLQRLEWAGLPADKYPFDLVTSFETFHFAKPSLAFLAEAIARVGWPEGPIVMVGDDWENDILPALRLGLPAYWLNAEPGRIPIAEARCGTGDLDGLLAWLDRQPPDDLVPSFSSPEAILAILRSTPAALGSLCFPFQPQEWNTRPEPDEWCPAEIVCHLRDVEFEVNLPRLRKVLSGGNPFIPGKDTDPWADERQYILQDGLRALQRFSSTRQRVLRILEKQPAEAWGLPARHSIFGPTSLRELVSIMAGHDRLHIRQLYQMTNPA